MVPFDFGESSHLNFVSDAGQTKLVLGVECTHSIRWTPSEDDAFRKMAAANIRPELIAAELNRSVQAIKTRAYAIGLPLKWFKVKAKPPK